MIDALVQRLTRRANAGLFEFDERVSKASQWAVVLCMGGGSITFTLAASEAAVAMMVIEPDQARIARGNRLAREAGLGAVQFIRRDPVETRIPGSTVDLVFGHDLVGRHGEAVLREAKRVLRHGGKFLSCEMNSRGGDEGLFRSEFPNGVVDRFGIVTRVSILAAIKGE